MFAFSAVHAGNYNGNYNNFGSYAHFWSAAQSGGSGAYGRDLSDYSASVGYGDSDKSSGYAVRCLCDN